MVPLGFLRRGQVAEIHEVVGPFAEVRRLEELGIRPGARVELLRGGSPCIVRIDGSTLCFREESSVRVLVAPRLSA
jgi:ferrous iron transport protein A